MLYWNHVSSLKRIIYFLKGVSYEAPRFVSSSVLDALFQKSVSLRSWFAATDQTSRLYKKKQVKLQL
jgi:hypothetical protein